MSTPAPSAVTPQLSVLDLVPVPSGTTAALALQRIGDLAQLAEVRGYARYWLAEHHGLPAIASSVPEILIAHVAQRTRQLRVGSGGIMLPNHPPLRVAEAFRTLAALHPGRIDLGLGRAPGSDAHASRALRAVDGERFPALLGELLAYGGRPLPQMPLTHSVRAVPEGVSLPPIWLLGSSGASATLAGQLGLGYSFAAHFSPVPAAPVLQAYRAAFQATAEFPRPHSILAVSVICAESAAQAQYLAHTLDLLRLRLIQRVTAYQPLPSPEEALAYPFDDEQREWIRPFRALDIVGDPQQVRQRLLALAADCAADELMIASYIHDHAARLRSYELIAEAMAMPPRNPS